MELTKALLPNNPIDYWRLINWLFVSWYWIFLSDFGHNAPTTYVYVKPSNIFSNAYYVTPDFATATQYPPTNNIFYNDTLFEIYSDYLVNTLYPLAPLFGQGVVQVPTFNPLNDNNRLEAISMSLLTSYFCTQRQMKDWLGVFVLVIVADFSILCILNSLLHWITGVLLRLGMIKGL